MKRVFTLLMIIFMIHNSVELLAQDCGKKWAIFNSNDCGNLVANGGLSSSTKIVFCIGEEVIFENNSSRATEITKTYIDWGDGNCEQFSGFQTNLKHTYKFPNDTCVQSEFGRIGIDIKLGVEIECGGKRSFHHISTPIVIQLNPVPLFSLAPNPACLNSNITIKNSSCENSSNAKYKWDLGGGKFDTTSMPPSQKYSTIGSKSIQLTLSNECGTRTLTENVQVTPDATAEFSVPKKLCKGDSITFLNNSLYAKGYKWTITPNKYKFGYIFKDSIFSKDTDREPKVVFLDTGRYVIKLAITGCAAPIKLDTILVSERAIVNLKDVNECSNIYILDPTKIVTTSGGKIDTYRWSFQNGSPTSFVGKTPPLVTFNTSGKVQLTVENGCDTVTVTANINLFEKPNADFLLDSLSNLNGCSPLAVFLQNNSVSANSYQWKIVPSIGYVLLSGSKLTDANVRLRFDTPGKYAIQLVASNSVCGNIADTLIKDITIKQGISATLDTIVNQCGDYLFDPAKFSKILNANSITWDFIGGNPSSSNILNPGLVKFSGMGSYKIVLKASNECGEKTIERNFKILEKPVLNILDTIKMPSYCTPFSTSFIDSSIYVDNRKWSITPNFGYNYLIGNDTSSNPTISFNVEGNYKVSYLGKNECGDINWDKMIQIKQSPKVALDSIIPECDNVIFNSLVKTKFSGNIDTYNWTFENGSISSSNKQYPNDVNFATSGIFQIKIIVQGQCGVDSAIKYVTVYKKEQINLDSIPISICNSNTPIQLNGLPSGGYWIGNFVTSSGVFNPKIANLGQNTLTYVFGSGSCEVRQSLNIDVLGNNIDVGNDLIVCSNQGLINLKSNYNGGIWFGDGIIDSLKGIYDPLLFGAGKYNIKYEYKDPNNGCINSDSLNIKINESPKAVLDSVGLICLNQPFIFKNKSTNIKKSYWDFGDGSTSTLINPTKTYTSVGNFIINLIVESIEGCIDTTSKNINVTSPPSIDFQIDNNEGCYPFPVTFTNNSNGSLVSYFWNFGNGDTSNIKDPSPIIYKQGSKDTIYFIKLNVKNGCASLNKLDSIKVKPQPQVNFGTNIDDGCTPLKIKFSNISVGNPKLWKWDFGNGLTSIDSIPLDQIFTTDSLIKYYTIRLIASNDCGIDTLERKITVKPVKSKAFFNIDTTSGCVPLTVNFTNFSSIGTQVYYDFGDGSKSSKPDTSHTYNLSGKYKIICYATDGCGYDSTIQFIDVLPEPIVAFTNAISVCENLPLEFINLSKDVFATKWDFGDGDTSNLINPIHSFKNSGNYIVRLTSKSLTTGCASTFSNNVIVTKSPNTNFEIIKNDGCQPFNAQFNSNNSITNYFKWDFGDGNTSTDKNPNHQYNDSGTFLVKLRVTDNLGCFKDTVYDKILIYPKPIADFTYNLKELCETPASINFKNNSIGADSYEWNFGNGMISVLNNPTANYFQAQQYKVELKSKNQYGCSDTTSIKIDLYPKPLADFEVLKQKICLGEQLSIKNLSVALNSFKWDFGDGNISLKNEPEYTYSKTGKYSITLYANNDNICFDTIMLTYIVEVLNKPIADFQWTDSLINSNSIGIINFKNKSQYSDSYFWDFGDTNKSKLINPTHRYKYNNNKTVELIASNINGCTDTNIQIINLKFFKGLYIPTAFSPENGVGDVRLFKPFGAGLINFKIEVFSSFGQRVWYSDKLENGQPTESWDGTLNGQILPQDIYIWKVKAIFENGQIWTGNGEDQFNNSNTGIVTLLR